MKEISKDKISDGEKVRKKQCFVMMPISDQGDYPSGHFEKVYNQIFKPAIEKAGYEPYRVDENTISDSIVNKIFDAVQNCEMALCDLSNRNPNVLYELGLRQAYNKPVVLVCDDKTQKIFDVSGISTVFYNSNRLYENVIDAQDKIYDALKSTSDGKTATLVQVVHATEANYNGALLDKDETIGIMLQSIMKELREVNRANTIHYTENEQHFIRTSIKIKNKYDYDHTKIFTYLHQLEQVAKVHVDGIQTIDENIVVIKITFVSYENYIEMRGFVTDFLEQKLGPVITRQVDS